MAEFIRLGRNLVNLDNVSCVDLEHHGNMSTSLNVLIHMTDGRELLLKGEYAVKFRNYVETYSDAGLLYDVDNPPTREELDIFDSLDEDDT